MAIQSETNIDDLPKFIIHDILLRSPTKSVIRARCVSRLWRKIIDDRPFRVMLKPDVRMILGCEPNKQSISLIRVGAGSGGVIEAKRMVSFRLLHGTCHFPRNCCNGLIYTRICYDDTVDGAVLDAFTGEIIKVRKWLRPTYYDERALGFDASTMTYKLVRVLSERPITAAVYSFKTRRWSVCEPPSHMIGDRCVCLPRGGSMNWLPCKLGAFTNSVISFDLRTEKFSSIRLPLQKDDRRLKFPSAHIFEYDGRLGLCHSLTHTSLDVWVIDDFEQQEWRKRHHILVPIPARPFGKPCSILSIYSDGKILIAAEQTLLSYDMANNELTTLVDAELVATIPLYRTTPNLVPLW